jgi:hypothetical protein
MDDAKPTKQEQGSLPKLTAEDLSSPLIKAWLKQKAVKAEQEKKARLIPGLLAAVKEKTGLKFDSIKELARYFEPKKAKTKKGKRSTPLSDSEKQSARTLKKEGKSVAEIAAALGKKSPQIYRLFNSE